MADASRPPPPFDWGAAFSALPQEAPPASRWPAIASALDARIRARRHRRLGLALAAGLCALAALPLALHLRRVPVPAAPDVASAAATTPRAKSAAPTASRASAAAAPVRATLPPPIATEARRPAPVAATASLRVAEATRDRAVHAAAPRHAAVRRTAGGWPERRGPAEASLESLYATSARLETLVALTRDPRVASGPAAAIAADHEAVLADIDARLAQPGLSIEAQRALWQARVSTLESAAGFESQFRLLALEGDRFDGALVSVD